MIDNFLRFYDQTLPPVSLQIHYLGPPLHFLSAAHGPIVLFLLAGCGAVNYFLQQHKQKLFTDLAWSFD